MKQKSLDSAIKFHKFHEFLILINAPSSLHEIHLLIASLKKSLPYIKVINVSSYRYFRSVITQYSKWSKTVDLSRDLKLHVSKEKNAYLYYLLIKWFKDSSGKINSSISQSAFNSILILISRRSTRKSRNLHEELLENKFIYDFFRQCFCGRGGHEIASVSFSRFIEVNGIRATSKGCFATSLSRYFRNFLLCQADLDGKILMPNDEMPRILLKFCRVLKRHEYPPSRWLFNLVDNGSTILDDFKKHPSIQPLTPLVGWNLVRSPRQNQHFDISTDHLSSSEYQELVSFLLDHIEDSADYLKCTSHDLFPIWLCLLTGWPISNLGAVIIDSNAVFSETRSTNMILNPKDGWYSYTVVRDARNAENLYEVIQLPLPLLLINLCQSLENSEDFTVQGYTETSIRHTIDRIVRRLQNSRLSIPRLEKSLFNFLQKEQGLLIAERLCFSQFQPTTTQKYLWLTKGDLEVYFRESMKRLQIDFSNSSFTNDISENSNTPLASTGLVNDIIDFWVNKVRVSKLELKSKLTFEKLADYFNCSSLLTQLVLVISTNHRPVIGQFGVGANLLVEEKIAFLSDKVMNHNFEISERYLSSAACHLLTEYRKLLKYFCSALHRLDDNAYGDVIDSIKHIEDPYSELSFFFKVTESGIRNYSPNEWLKEYCKVKFLNIRSNFYRHNWVTWCQKQGVESQVIRLQMGHEYSGEAYLSRYTNKSMDDIEIECSKVTESYLEQYDSLKKVFSIRSKKLPRGHSLVNVPKENNKVVRKSFKIPKAMEYERKKQRDSDREFVLRSVDVLFEDITGRSHPRHPVSPYEHDKIISNFDDSDIKNNVIRDKVYKEIRIRLTRNFDDYGGYINEKIIYRKGRFLLERPLGVDLNIGSRLKLASGIVNAIDSRLVMVDRPSDRIAWIYLYMQIKLCFCFTNIDEFLSSTMRWKEAGMPKHIEVGEVGVNLKCFDLCPSMKSVLMEVDIKSSVSDIAVSVQKIIGSHCYKHLKEILNVYFLKVNGGFELTRRIERIGSDYPKFEDSILLSRQLDREIFLTQLVGTFPSYQVKEFYRSISRKLSVKRKVNDKDRKYSVDEFQKLAAVIETSEKDVMDFLVDFWKALNMHEVKNRITTTETFLSYLGVILKYLYYPLKELLQAGITNFQFSRYVKIHESSHSHLITTYNHLQNFLARRRMVDEAIPLSRVSGKGRNIAAVAVDQLAVERFMERLSMEPFVVSRIYSDAGIRPSEIENVRMHHLRTLRYTGLLMIATNKHKGLKTRSSHRVIKLENTSFLDPFLDSYRHVQGHVSLLNILHGLKKPLFSSENLSSLKFDDLEGFLNLFKCEVGVSSRALRHKAFSDEYASDLNSEPWYLTSRSGHSTPERLLDTYINIVKPVVYPEKLRNEMFNLAILTGNKIGTLRKKRNRYNKLEGNPNA